MKIMIPAQVYESVRTHAYPLLFATVSGAHLYGFPSPDSDWDLRGVHVLPAREVLGLMEQEETITITREEEIELDLVTHDIEKFFRLLLRPNGYVLEQLFSPIVVHSTQEFEELRAIAEGCITRNHVYHYLGFADSQWKLLQKEEPPRVKPLLYTFRVLLTGIYLMQTGKVEANLLRLNEVFRLPFIKELVERKTLGGENQTLEATELAVYEKKILSLREQLVVASERSSLPEKNSCKNALSDLLVRTRLKTI